MGGIVANGDIAASFESVRDYPAVLSVGYPCKEFTRRLARDIGDSDAAGVPNQVKHISEFGMFGCAVGVNDVPEGGGLWWGIRIPRRCSAGDNVGARGKSAIVPVPGQRQSVSAASAINARGGFWFATYKGGMSAELFIEMLKVLMRRRRKPLFPVLDSLPAHKAKIVQDYVVSTRGKLEFHFLPGYAPELTPDELVWNYMKRTATAKRPLVKGELLHDRIDTELLSIKRNSALVRSFFSAEHVSNISD